MSSFSERLKRLGSLTQQNIAEKASADLAPKQKRKKVKPEIPTAPELTPEDLVIKSLAGQLDWKIRQKRVIECLKQGFLNDSWLIDVKGEGQFIVRQSIPGANHVRAAWNTSLDKEYVTCTAAGRNSVAPSCTQFLADTNVLLFKYLPDFVVWDSAKIREHYRECLALLKLLHGIPIAELSASAQAALPFNVFEACEEHLSYCRTHQLPLPDGVDQYFTALREWRSIMCSVAPPPECAFVLCHNDLSGANFLARNPKNIKEELQLRLVDFEFAALGDRFFDLANFSRLNDFSDEEDVLLLKIYFNRFDDKHMVRLQMLKAVADLHEAMRGLAAAVPISKGLFTPRQPTPAVKSGLEGEGQPKENELIETDCLFPAGRDPNAETPTPAPAPISEPSAHSSSSSADKQPEPSGPEIPNEDTVVKQENGEQEESGQDSKPSWGVGLPKALRDRIEHCLSVFAAKAQSPEYTEYLRSGFQ